jgi:hypothetical protein
LLKRVITLMLCNWLLFQCLSGAVMVSFRPKALGNFVGTLPQPFQN